MLQIYAKSKTLLNAVYKLGEIIKEQNAALESKPHDNAKDRSNWSTKERNKDLCETEVKLQRKVDE
jgi:hypothetical protein